MALQEKVLVAKTNDWSLISFDRELSGSFPIAMA